MASLKRRLSFAARTPSDSMNASLRTVGTYPASNTLSNGVEPEYDINIMACASALSQCITLYYNITAHIRQFVLVLLSVYLSVSMHLFITNKDCYILLKKKKKEREKNNFIKRLLTIT